MEAGARPILVYDGRCRFCVDQATRLERWLAGRVSLESFRDPGVLERHPGLTLERCEEAIQLVEPDGRITSGAEAISRALRLRLGLAPVGWLYLVPGLRQALDWGYRIVARNRFRLRGEACEDDACSIHHGARSEARADRRRSGDSA